MRRVEAAVVVALLCAVLVLVYAGARVVQAWLYPEPNPALVIWSTRIALFWRMALAAYVALIVAPLALRWARRDLEGVCRVAAWLLPASGLLLAVQAAFFP